MKRIMTYVVIVFGGVFAVMSCARPPIERAIKRDLLPSEANVIVLNHCQGCHVHSDMDVAAHMLLVKERYAEGNPLREAKECLDCHVLKLENYFRKEKRSTTRPHGQLVQMTDIPKPAAPKAGGGKGTSIRSAPVKKEKKWYFFYLF